MTYQRHPLEIGPLVFGLVFLGIVAAWALFELDVVSGASAAWILPVVLIVAGALGVVLAATKPQRTRPEYTPVTDPAAAWPAPMQDLPEPAWMAYDQEATRHAATAYDEAGRYPAADADTDIDTDTNTNTDTDTASTTETPVFDTEEPQKKEHDDE
ncbi:MAG TPA: hypothetical protein VHG70_07525 [Nocardioidaceae bacterium]|nr:hypothetical protein [Nocardioidaceae bacterium]